MIRDDDLNGNGDPSDEIPFASRYGGDRERCFIPLRIAFGIKTSGDAQFCVLDDGSYTMVYEHPRSPEYPAAVRELYAEGLIASEFNDMSLAEINVRRSSFDVHVRTVAADQLTTASRRLIIRELL